jgi:SsrA-binding protein
MAKNKEDKNYRPTINNRRASHDFTFLEVYETGIVLTGTEIKSIREGKIQFSDAYCLFKDEELYVLEMHISPYDFGNINNVDPRRDRKLLISKKERKKLKAKSEEQGLTIIPVKIYFNERNFAKLQIALAKGKKLFDKRHDIKEKDTDRQMKRELSE